MEVSHSLARTRTSSPSRASSPSSALALSSPPPSPFLFTLQVVRLVNTFRKRATARIHARRPKRATATGDRRDFCHEFERLASAEIDRYLGRANDRHKHRDSSAIGTLPAITNTKVSYPPAKSIDWYVHKVSNLTSTAFVPLHAIALNRKEGALELTVTRLLRELDHSVTCDERPLATLAKDDHQFLNRKADFNVKCLSFKKLTELVIITKYSLEILRRTSGTHSLCEGNEILNPEFDELFLANLEHLLYCLQDQLLRALVLCCVGLVRLHVLECQQDQQKHCIDWFFEWPDTRHPLSTTWPWSIRPSLAVIWGVCWMFHNFGTIIDSGTVFDSEGNIVDLLGNIEVPSAIVQQFIRDMQQTDFPSANNDSNLSRPMAGNSEIAARAAPQPPLPLHLNLSPSMPHLHQSGVASAYDQLAAQSTSRNAYGAAPTLHTALPDSQPQENFAFDSSVLQPNLDPYPADPSAHRWQQPSYSSAPAVAQASYDSDASPPHTRIPLTPSIRLTTDFPGAHLGVQQIPQDGSFYSSSTNSTLQDWDPYFEQFNNTYLSPQFTRRMDQIPHDSMRPPGSPIRIQSPGDNETLSEVLSRKRPHSQMDDGIEATLPLLPSLQQMPIEQNSRPNSIASQPPRSASPTGEDYSPRGSRSFKRGNPPHNHNGKYICDFDPIACADQIFDRKCEWSKHMDKHDRPYRCNNSDCAKLQGFTYSGGLLRHEREVHGKHGGPKAQLMCPHDECKRHSGKGFTRKENLNEHIRRVHDNKPEPTQQQHSEQQTTQYAEFMPGLQEAAAGAEQVAVEQAVEPPIARMYSDINVEELAVQPDLGPLLGKRKRNDNERSPSVDVEELKQEIKRLREDNASKDDRLRRMELSEAMRESRMQSLEQTLNGLQQSRQGEHISHGHPQPVGLAEQLEHYQHDLPQQSEMDGQGEHYSRDPKDELDELGVQSFSQDQQIRV